MKKRKIPFERIVLVNAIILFVIFSVIIFFSLKSNSLFGGATKLLTSLSFIMLGIIIFLIGLYYDKITDSQPQK